jgi:hypothetical protein
MLQQFGTRSLPEDFARYSHFSYKYREVGTTARALRSPQLGGQMEPIVLLKIKSLHARSLPETGLSIRYGGSDILTGPIVACLDECAEVPANMGMIDLATGAIRLQWAVIATLPFLADAFASGAISQKDSEPVRATLDEHGHVLDDGSGLDMKATGKISPGSVLSGAKIGSHQNLAKFVRIGRTVNFIAALAAGEAVRCAFVPEFSALEVKLPKSLGGRTQRLNLTGGFLLVPVMMLERPDRSKQSRR